MVLKASAVGTLSFAFWLLILASPYITLSDWYDRVETSMALNQALGLGIFLSAYLLLQPSRLLANEFIRLNTLKGVSITFFFVVVGILSIVSVNPSKSLIYATLTFLIFISGATFWNAEVNQIKTAFLLAGIGIFIVLLAALIINGMPNGRTVGGIQPNQYGKLSYTAMLCLFFARSGFVRTVSLLLAIGLSYVVSSRGTLGVIALFCFFYYAWPNFKFKLSSRLVSNFLIYFSSFVLFLGFAFLSGYLNSITGHMVEQMAVFDEIRGVGSGLTGRVDRWADGLTLFLDSPILGYGFRTAEGLTVAHNGYLNLLVDVGAVAATLIFIAIFADMRVRLRNHSQQANQDPTRRDWSTLAFAVLVANMPLWFFEPIYLNIGAAYSVLFLLVFAMPSPTVMVDKVRGKRAPHDDSITN